jgi:hypothetical protein
MNSEHGLFNMVFFWNISIVFNFKKNAKMNFCIIIRFSSLYYNWPGSVRVPAACQYAHKLAYLVGLSLKQQTNEKLADKLYYL